MNIFYIINIYYNIQSNRSRADPQQIKQKIWKYNMVWEFFHGYSVKVCLTTVLDVVTEYYTLHCIVPFCDEI